MSVYLSTHTHTHTHTQIGIQWVHESTLHVFCKLCTFLRYSRVAVSGLETIRKLLGVGELLYFETELQVLMCVLDVLFSVSRFVNL